MLTLKRCRSCGQIELYVMYLSTYTMYICAYICEYMCVWRTHDFNTLIDAKMTTALARVYERVAEGVYACACKTRARNSYTRAHEKGGRAELHYKVKLGEQQWDTGSAWYRAAKAT